MFRFSAARLKALRADAGLTLMQTAHRAGLSYTTIQSYEGGLRVPRLDNLFALAAALGVDPGDLVEKVDELEVVVGLEGVAR